MKSILSAFGLVSTIALAAAPLSAASIGVQPLVVEVEPGRSTSIRVRNVSDESTSIETVVAERLIDADGEEIGRGTGTFMRSRMALSGLPGYRPA